MTKPISRVLTPDQTSEIEALGKNQLLMLFIYTTDNAWHEELKLPVHEDDWIEQPENRSMWIKLIGQLFGLSDTEKRELIRGLYDRIEEKLQEAQANG